MYLLEIGNNTSLASFQAFKNVNQNMFTPRFSIDIRLFGKEKDKQLLNDSVCPIHRL